MITIKSKNRNYSVTFPQSVDELKKEHFASITKGIKIPKYHCIVALCFKTKLFDFCTMIRSNNKNTNVNVSPVLAKISEEDAKELNVEVGEKIIVNRSALEMATHLNLNTAISSEAARSYINSDENLIKGIITKDGTMLNDKINKSLASSQSTDIVILEFKILPVNDIKGSIETDRKFLDPFIKTNCEA